jgi:hypothetical protein
METVTQNLKYKTVFKLVGFQTFDYKEATLFIVGRFAGRKWKNVSEWYI